MAEAFVYRPLCGITSHFSPQGLVTTYEYDEYDRLKTIKDDNGKILKSIDYHYRAPGSVDIVPTTPKMETKNEVKNNGEIAIFNTFTYGGINKASIIPPQPPDYIPNVDSLPAYPASELATIVFEPKIFYSRRAVMFDFLQNGMIVATHAQNFKSGAANETFYLHPGTYHVNVRTGAIGYNDPFILCFFFDPQTMFQYGSTYLKPQVQLTLQAGKTYYIQIKDSGTIASCVELNQLFFYE
jgi:YD repeat-containing protein